ncbi:KR domain-containing protein, partial [archaeon]
GQSAYGAANRYLDVLMEERRKLGMVGTSIRWPAISGKGMSAVTQHVAELTSYAPLCLESFEFFLRYILLGTASQQTLTVCPSSLAAVLLESQKTLLDSSIAEEAVAEHGIIGLGWTQGEAESSELAQSVEDLQRTIRDIIKYFVQQHEGFDDDSNLLSSGLDSFATMEAAARLSKIFGRHIAPMVFINYPTIRSLAQFMHCKMYGRNSLEGEGATDNLNAAQSLEDEDMTVVQLTSIVGTACRFPGEVNSLDAVWQVLQSKTCCSTKAPTSRWDADEIMAASREDASGAGRLEAACYGSFVSDEVLETFHAQDFNISRAEAESMDVVQRLLLEVSYDAFLDAGYEKAELDGKRVGVFVAASGSTEGAYQMSGAEKGHNSTATAPAASPSSIYQTTGYALSVAAGRISFVFGLQGPCMTIDTACSSSLVALHTARRALEHD